MSWKVKGDWVVESDAHGVTVESGGMTQFNGKGTEVAWPDSAYRVKVEGKPTKVFKGECAWSDADRFANDARLKVMYS